jgi:hypothetical protein
VGGRGHKSEVRQVLGGNRPVLDTSQDITMDGYGFRWLRLPGETALL